MIGNGILCLQYGYYMKTYVTSSSNLIFCVCFKVGGTIRKMQLYTNIQKVLVHFEVSMVVYVKSLKLHAMILSY